MQWKKGNCFGVEAGQLKHKVRIFQGSKIILIHKFNMLHQHQLGILNLT